MSDTSPILTPEQLAERLAGLPDEDMLSVLQSLRVSPEVAPEVEALANSPHIPRANPTYPEDVYFDPWHWLAILENGEEVEEYCPETAEHRNFAATVARGVTKLALLPAYPDRYPGLQPLVVLVPPGGRPIVRRVRQSYGILNPSGHFATDPRVTIVGFQQTVKIGRGVRNTQALLALYDDGSIMVTHDRANI
jgi:hypothetical protein